MAASRVSWVQTLLGIGVGILFCGAALIAPQAGYFLLAVGLGVISGALVYHFALRELWSVIFGVIVAMAFYFGLLLTNPVSNKSVFSLSKEQEFRFKSAAISPPDGPHLIQFTVSGPCSECQAFEYSLRDILNDLPGWHAGVGQMFGAAATIREWRFGFWINSTNLLLRSLLRKHFRLLI